MKKATILLMMLTIASCQKTMEPWPTEDENSKNVDVYIRTSNLTGINADPSIYQFFMYDSLKGIVTSHSINTNNSSNHLQLRLLPGIYSAYCMTNTNQPELWDYSESDPPSEIYLSSNENTGDHLLGSTKIVVKEEGENNATFKLERKVAMLRVSISNIPENMNDLKINVSDIPENLSLTGKYSGSNTISKSIDLPNNYKISDTSETSILLFPPEKKATISLSSENLQFMSLEHDIDTILVNHITEINIKLWPLSTVPKLDITSQLVLWNERVIEEDDLEVIVPDSPCSGSGNGYNSVLNGSFEEGFNNSIPVYWELRATSDSYIPKVTEINSPISTGQKAIEISSKTYLSQEIGIIGGRCYQFKVHINSPHKDVEWQVWGTWQTGSTALTALSQIIRTESQNTTDGYIDAYNGKVFRAPQSANKLHIEIKNMSDTKVTEGLYIDDVSIELVE